MSLSRHLKESLGLLAAGAAFAALAQTVSAQTADTSVPAAPTQDEAVQMSAFEVRTTAGTGYSPGNIAQALRSNSSLMDTPNQIIVVTNDLIKDIGADNTSDILAYAGVGSYYRGPTMEVRGSRIAGAYIDGAPVSLVSGVEDDEDIDTIEVIKGPVQIFYPSASLGGTVIKTSKKPLPDVTAYSVTASATNWGGTRDSFDFNGPLGQFGDGKLTYRLVGVYQGGTASPFYNVSDKHEAVWADVEWDWNNTSILVQYDVQIIDYLAGGTDFLTPTGDLYTGWNDRREEGAPANDQAKDEQHEARITITQKLSENWSARFFYAYQNFLTYGIVSYGSGSTNWNAATPPQLTYSVLLNQAYADTSNIQADVLGKYMIGGKIPAQTALGFNTLDSRGISAYWNAPSFTIPGTKAAIQSVTLPTQVPEPANPGTRSESYPENAYFMEQVDVIPTWLTLVGGFTFSKIESIADTNIAISGPYLATDLNGHDLLHRIAAIIHVTKDFMIYGTESTTFSPSSGVTYLDVPVPPVQGKSDEVGFKTSFFNGRLSSSFALYNMTLTNQTILAPYPALNIAGLNYYIPIGSTRSRGWDCSLALNPLPGWQIIAAGYDGTVEDQNGSPLSQTYDNQWDVFSRYEFGPTSALNGFAFGGGITRIGARYFNTSGIVAPGYLPPPNASGFSLFKVHEGSMVNGFVTYRFTKHWDARLSCENILDVQYPQGLQGIGLVDPADPRTFTLATTYKF